jgi:hypothetical protein
MLRFHGAAARLGEAQREWRRKVNRKIIVPLAGALALAALEIGAGSASAAPMGITPKASVDTPSQLTDVQYRYRRYGYRGYRRGWGGPAVGAAIGLGVLGAAAAAASSPYYGGYGYPAYGGYGGYGYPYGGGYYSPY